MSRSYSQVNVRLPSDLVEALKAIAGEHGVSLTEVIRRPLEVVADSHIKTVRTQVRLPHALHADLVASAAKAGHSMNAEIVRRLWAASEHGEPA